MPSASVDISALKNILLALEQCWSESGDKDAMRYADLLKASLSGELVEVPQDFEPCQAPCGLCMEAKSTSQNLFQALFQLWNHLDWTVPKHFKTEGTLGLKDKIKEARLIGPTGPIKSNKIDIKISYVSPNTFVPRHSEEAEELLQIIEGDDIEIGLAVDDWLEKKDFHFFPPTFPKVVKVAENQPFVAISAHAGKIGGKLWLNDELNHVGTQYHGMADCKNVEEYFDNVYKVYDKAMKNWGYCMPELLSNSLIEHGSIKPSDSVKILDLGCGDGAVGQALHDKGFTNLKGIDISKGMISVAKERNVYKDIMKSDLMKDLPFQKEEFDCLVSSAVTTYLEPSALEKWLPVIKKGGLLAIVHKELIFPKWIPEQERLESCGVLKLIWYSPENLPYLPSLDAKGTNKGRIYIYKKL